MPLPPFLCVFVAFHYVLSSPGAHIISSRGGVCGNILAVCHCRLFLLPSSCCFRQLHYLYILFPPSWLVSRFSFAAAAIMANNFFDSGFDEFLGELANFTLPFPGLPLPAPSAASNRRQHTSQPALGRPASVSFELPRLPAFGAVWPVPSAPPPALPPLPALPGASSWSAAQQWQPPRQPAQAGARPGAAASFISRPTFSLLHGAPHPPTPMPSTAPVTTSLPGPFFHQPSTTIGSTSPSASAQSGPANLPQPRRATVNNPSQFLPSSSRPANPLHNTVNTPRTITPTPPVHQREPNSDDFYLNQLTPDFSTPSLESDSDRFYLDQLSRDFSSPSLPSTSATLQRSATRSNNPGTNNAFSQTLHRILPPPAPPAGLRAPPPPSTRSTPTSNTNEESSDSDSAYTMPASSRPVRRRSGQADRLTLPHVPRVSGASSSSGAATANQSQANSSKSQLSHARTAPQTTPRRASNGSISAAGSGTKRKREAFESDDDDLFGDNDLEVVDLVDKDVADLTSEEKEKEEDRKKNWVKLSQFQCVICMDDVTDLTVTYCGHLFCSECLHSALQITPHKRICPICRQKIENKNASGKFGPKSKGYYPLEIKLMTKKSLGKKVAVAAAAGRNTGEH
ncbi:hypothetical protein QC762_707580 [Podospora pseudocomata]|uniref:RING-type domain-containing protein n=1 Tax=Podospora pseudocomata TaxID=2093779 RepID=A0ABR0G462_9PEZI|nr:hypothetical protein QC762_707580 [Podospora pseudocomata]